MKRRRVVRTAWLYLVVAWIVIEVASTTFPILLLPSWATRLVLSLAILGFPVVLVLSWLFDIRPPSEGDVTTVPSLTPHMRRLLRFSAAILLLFGVAGSGYAFARERAPSLNPRRIFVATFTNRTTDPALGELGHMAADWITQGLFRSQLGEVVDQTTVSLLTRQLDTVQRPDSGTLPVESAILSGAGTLVTGAYYLRGDSVVLNAQLIDAGTRRVIRIIDPITAPRADPMSGIETLRQRVVAAVAVLLDSGARGAMSLSTPPSFEAYNEFTRGREADARGKRLEAGQHYTRAAAMDTNFIAARIELVQYEHNSLDSTAWTRGDSMASALLSRPERLTTAERVQLERLRARFAGDREEAYRASKRWLQYAPAVATNIAVDAMRTGRYHEVIKTVESIDPKARSAYDWGRHWVPLTLSYHMLGQHRRELHAARTGLKFYEGQQAPILTEINALAALGREKDVMNAVERALVIDTAGGVAWTSAVAELRAHNHDEAAKRVAQAGMAWVSHRPSSDRVRLGVRRTEAFLREALGDYSGALATTEAILQMQLTPRGREVMTRSLAVLLAKTGQTARADTVLAGLVTTAPATSASDLRLRSEHELSAGIIAAALHRPDDAVRYLLWAADHGAYVQLIAHGAWPIVEMQDYGPLKELFKVRD